MQGGEKRIALLIDADNVPATRIDEVLTAAERYGSVTVRLAFGDWSRSNLKSWKAILPEHLVEPVRQIAHTRRKNATDMAMVIGAMDLLHANSSIDAYALVSSDADFTPLVERLLKAGVNVYGIGEKHAPRSFRDVCTEFTVLRGVKRSSKVKQLAIAAVTPTKHGSPARDPKKLRADARLLQRLRSAVDATKAKSGWANLAKVRNHMGEDSFDQRTYGYRKFSSLMEATDLFEIRRVGMVAQVRVKPKT